jgi:hypothetical protein
VEPNSLLHWVACCIDCFACGLIILYHLFHHQSRWGLPNWSDFIDNPWFGLVFLLVAERIQHSEVFDASLALSVNSLEALFAGRCSVGIRVYIQLANFIDNPWFGLVFLLVAERISNKLTLRGVLRNWGDSSEMIGRLRALCLSRAKAIFQGFGLYNKLLF